MAEPVQIAIGNVPDHVRDSVIGGTRRISLTVYAPFGMPGQTTPTDADALLVKIQPGDDQDVVEYELGKNPELVKDEATGDGRYYVDLAYAASGSWTIRAEASGEYVGASERGWNVKDSVFG